MSQHEIIRLLNVAQRAAQKAENANDSAERDRAVDALRALKGQPVTAKLLAETSAGKTVKKLTKSEVKAVADAALEVVSTWKDAVRKSGTNSAASTGSAEAPAESGAATKAGGDDGQTEEPSSAVPSEADLAIQHTGDKQRDKIRTLLVSCLQLAYPYAPGSKPGLVASQIEQAMFDKFRGMSKEYKTKFRSLQFNLKDAKNPDLRRRVLTQQLFPEELVTLSAEELASDQKKQENAAIRQGMLKESERGQVNVQTTDIFQCGRCKERKCTYYQMQTRSADEPMTTFVTCVPCGNRWKFCSPYT